jgi:acyl-CoA synthetase (NDP forming)
VTFAEIGSKETGPIGIVSQSGGLGTDIIRRGFGRGLKFSGLVTVGNSADVSPNELLEFYLADAQTRVIGMYIESAKDGRRLFEILRHARAAKPVVILKGGRTRQGLAAVVSHTGSLAGDERAWVALSRQGLDVSLFGKETVDALASMRLPPGTSITNPVDCPVGTFQQEDGRVAEQILDIIYRQGRPDALVMHLNMSAFVGRSKPEVLDNLVQAALRVQSRHPGQAHFLLVLRSDGEPVLEDRKRAFRASAVAMGIPVYDENANAGRALAAMQTHEMFLSARNSPAGGEQQRR